MAEGHGFSLAVFAVGLLARTTTCFLTSGPTQVCDFESGICSYDVDYAAKLSWRRKTVFSSSFPTTDHTRNGGSYGHVLYATGSSLAKLGDTARIDTPEFFVPPYSRVSVGFWVMGKGTHPFTLMVFINGATSSSPQYKHSVSESSWTHVCVSAAASGNVTVTFDALYVGGGSETAVVAIDDVTLEVGYYCTSNSHSMTSTSSPLSTTAPPPANVSCNFEHGTCGYSNYTGYKDEADWRLHQGTTFSSGTGPSGDHTTGHGHYMYLEATGLETGDKAILMSPGFHADGYQKVTFWYHMYGSNMGTLNVRTETHGVRGPNLFSVSNDAGQMWHMGCVEIRSYASTTHLVFEAIRQGYMGDIAIDDIKLSHGTCGGSNYYNHTSGYQNYTTYPSSGAVNNTYYQPTSTVSSSNGTTYATLVDGAWGSWVTWSSCSTSCDMGVITRQRSCDHPVPSGGGTNCTGDSTESHDCSLGPCPEWSHWYKGDCSVSCGNGTMERVRKCSTGNSHDCAGSDFEILPCEGMECI